MKGYWIVKANTVNAEKQKDYACFASKAVEKYKGRYLVRGGQSSDKEGLTFERNVVVEFESYEIAKQAYESEEYHLAKNILGDEKDRIFAVVEGT